MYLKSSSFCWQQWNGHVLAWQKDQFVVHLWYLANILLPHNFDHVVRPCLYDRLWSWCSLNNGERERHREIEERIQTMVNSFGLHCPLLVSMVITATFSYFFSMPKGTRFPNQLFQPKADLISAQTTSSFISATWRLL